jgi:hypothetical protein
MSIGGFMPVASAAQLEAEDKKAAAIGQQQAPIQGLAQHVRGVWQVARTSKEQTVEPRLLANLRVRRGEYDPNELEEIRKQGGSEIYMMIGSTKCRAAASWLRDVMVAVRDEKPWTLMPTPIPNMSPQIIEEVKAKATQMLAQYMMATGQMPDEATLRQILTQMRDEFIVQLRDEAVKKSERMEEKMEDQLLEGGFLKALNEFIDDITTFPTAFIKGPVIRRKPRLKWEQDPLTGEYKPNFSDDLVVEWERVSPFDMYPHPAMTDINDSMPLIQRHRLTRSQLNELIGVEGYDDAAIRAVIDEYGKGGLREWLMVDTSRAQAEGRNTVYAMTNNEGTIDALQFFGPVPGSMLLDWGMTEQQVPEKSKEYHCEVWLIGHWVIKAVLNFDPLGRKPYYASSYERVPGVFWGNSVVDLCKDSQKMCNAAARALANNMGIASGPQSYINVDRLPAGEEITEMYPWKIWQVTSDPMGSGGDPIKFFQPNMYAQELMAIFQQFSVRADEDTGIPRYMTGESPSGGAGRTASGLSMLLGNASKTIKHVVSNVDLDIVKPVLERLFDHNMMFADDPELKGDVQIVARGATSIMLKESAQVRRNEFLATVAQNPVLSQIVGMEGIATLLRESAKTLDMPNVDKIVPNLDKVKLMQMLQANLQAAQAQSQGQEAEKSASRPNNSGQELTNGAPVTDNFSPQPQ